MAFRHIIATGALVSLIGSTPEITGVAPEAPMAGNQAQTLTVSGKDFLPGLSLEVRTPDGRTQLVNGGSVVVQSATSFTAQALLERAGTYSLKVINQDGGQSAPFGLAVKGAAPEAVPIVIDRVVPDAPAKSQQAQTLRLEGKNLDSGIVVNVMDPAGAEVPNVSVGETTPNSASVTVLLNQAGSYVLTASNYAGGTSNRITIRVQ